VNDIAMALFFGLLAQEVFESVMPGGALHTWRRWTTPIVAALGATIVAPAVFLLYAHIKHEAILIPTWPVACAIDVVAAYYVLTAIKVRRGVLAFALLMAIAANAMALLIVAPRQPFADVHPAGLLLIAAALGIAGVMRTRDVMSFWPYLTVCGTLSWFGFYLSGLHPALALMPIVLFLPHEPRALEDFPDTPMMTRPTTPNTSGTRSCR
jgi:NhaA family Na+:H+ antiporter